jgi:uncharacterized membrane protein
MIFSGSIGLIHLIVSIFALVFGTWVLAVRKGTETHRKVGYLYTISMVLLIATALSIYRLFGTFGVFHVAAVLSAITLAGGMIPVFLRRPTNSWLGLHFSFMYWSVFGLYAAFVAEMATRLPIRTIFDSPKMFFITVAVSTFATMMVGQIIFFKKKKKWQNILGEPPEKEKSSLHQKELA